MKKIFTILLGLSLLGALAPGLSAADRAAAKAKREEALLKKYDKNGDGKLDESEKAAAKEDQKKNRKEKRAEKTGKADKKTDKQ